MNPMAHIRFANGAIEQVAWTISGGWAATQEIVAITLGCQMDDVELEEDAEGVEHLTVRGKRVGTVSVY